MGHTVSLYRHRWAQGGLGGFTPPLDPLNPPPWRTPPRRPKHKFTLPLLDPREQKCTQKKNFLCKNALKVKFTLSLFDPRRTSFELLKKFRCETLKTEVFRKSILTPPPPPGGPTVPTYVFNQCINIFYYGITINGKKDLVQI